MAAALGVGTYERLPMRWFGVLNVLVLRCHSSRRRRAYDAMVDFGGTGRNSSPVLLIEEGAVQGQHLVGLCSLSGVIVRGGRERCAQLILDRDTSSAGQVDGLARVNGPGLTVSGRGLVLRDALVCTDSFGDEWRVASLMHREWDNSVSYDQLQTANDFSSCVTAVSGIQSL
ncbi:uncharacterized protein MELLADRAFT_103063 [Melampsora larici-populina 98AG31]|uniref:Uncharacterized protein n=1 Tax=Melampsora larici-populina (strain 98AG31 / pathotype 3-4-7) TaxID=747676 RepID=F4RAF1_MELLP|nr:uncharacterized protein MELLADRAFT_103063 [Melampsora larici-populina 98AG31]EGG10793.1 hypothetical protein MELLADRAFT_103063 [Melampsora larici-populina 98AG31]